MTGKVYKTSQGQVIDLGTLILRNENVAAVGNMNVNARGERIEQPKQRQDVRPVARRAVAPRKSNVARQKPDVSSRNAKDRLQAEDDRLRAIAAAQFVSQIPIYPEQVAIAPETYTVQQIVTEPTTVIENVVPVTEAVSTKTNNVTDPLAVTLDEIIQVSTEKSSTDSTNLLQKQPARPGGLASARAKIQSQKRGNN